jgi:hypothetical protein
MAGLSRVLVILGLAFILLLTPHAVSAGAQLCDTDPPVNGVVKGTSFTMDVHIMVHEGDQAAVENAKVDVSVHGNNMFVTVSGMSVEYRVYGVMEGTGAIVGNQNTVHAAGSTAVLIFHAGAITAQVYWD